MSNIRVFFVRLRDGRNLLNIDNSRNTSMFFRRVNNKYFRSVNEQTKKSPDDDGKSSVLRNLGGGRAVVEFANVFYLKKKKIQVSTKLSNKKDNLIQGIGTINRIVFKCK